MADQRNDISHEQEMSVTAAAPDPKNVQELTQYGCGDANQTAQLKIVMVLLQQMQERFQSMSDQIITRIDEMGNRIDGLETNIADLMTQAGPEEADK